MLGVQESPSSQLILPLRNKYYEAEALVRVLPAHHVARDSDPAAALASFEPGASYDAIILLFDQSREETILAAQTWLPALAARKPEVLVCVGMFE